MFQGWGFLLGEIWILIALAALLGLFIGWLVWGRRSVVTDDGEAARLRAELDACQTRARDCAQRVTRLEDDLSVARAASAVPIRASSPRRAAVSPEASQQAASRRRWMRPVTGKPMTSSGSRGSDRSWRPCATGLVFGTSIRLPTGTRPKSPGLTPIWRASRAGSRATTGSRRPGSWRRKTTDGCLGDRKGGSNRLAPRRQTRALRVWGAFWGFTRARPGETAGKCNRVAGQGAPQGVRTPCSPCPGRRGYKCMNRARAPRSMAAACRRSIFNS